MTRVLQTAVDLITGDTWPKRRKVVYVTLVFCALIIAFCLGAAVAARDMRVVEAASDNAFYIGASIVFAYVFGSVWDDFNKRKHQAGKPTDKEGGE